MKRIKNCYDRCAATAAAGAEKIYKFKHSNRNSSHRLI